MNTLSWFIWLIFQCSSSLKNMFYWILDSCLTIFFSALRKWWTLLYVNSTVLKLNGKFQKNFCLSLIFFSTGDWTQAWEVMLIYIYYTFIYVIYIYIYLLYVYNIPTLLYLSPWDTISLGCPAVFVLMIFWLQSPEYTELQTCATTFTNSSVHHCVHSNALADASSVHHAFIRSVLIAALCLCLLWLKNGWMSKTSNAVN